jgi:hypothetical protein
MKLRLVLYSAFFAGVHASLAQSPPAATPQPPRPHSLSMDVKVVGNGGGSKVNIGSASASGSDTLGRGVTVTTATDARKTNHSTTLEISIHNFSQLPDDIEVETHFYATKYEGGGKDRLLDSSTKKLTVAPLLTESFTVRSKEVSSKIIKKFKTATGSPYVSYDPIASNKVSGEKISGWVVQLIADGKILQVRGSSARFEDMGRHNLK